MLMKEQDSCANCLCWVVTMGNSVGECDNRHSNMCGQITFYNTECEYFTEKRLRTAQVGNAY